jgi:hypothetical protein
MWLLAATVLTAQLAAQAPPSVESGRVAVSPPRIVTEIDMNKLKGKAVRLAWSFDGLQVYLRTSEFDHWQNERAVHCVITLADGALVRADSEPIWAGSYWLWKAGVIAPGLPGLRMESETQAKIVTAVGSTASAPGVSNPNQSDPSRSQVASDMASAQVVAKRTVKVKGTVVAEMGSDSGELGTLVGWAPAPLGVMAFVDRSGQLKLVDREGHTVDVPGTSDVLLPAWSPDGKRLAFLQRKGKKALVLNVVEVEFK